jgi:hypothetical protein
MVGAIGLMRRGLSIFRLVSVVGGHTVLTREQRKPEQIDGE